MTSNIKIKKNNNEVSSIIIDEPKTYNSLSFKNLSDLLKAFKKLDADKKVKVIILEGAGTVSYTHLTLPTICSV